MKAKSNNPNLNSRKNSWIKSLYGLFAIALPALLLWIFFSDDFLAIQPLALWAKWLVALGFLVVSTLVTSILVYWKILEINVLAFTLPVAICFMSIFLTTSLEPWARALIVLPLILLTIPIHMVCQRLELRQHYRAQQAQKGQSKRKSL